MKTRFQPSGTKDEAARDRRAEGPLPEEQPELGAVVDPGAALGRVSDARLPPTPADILALQRAAGNRAVSGLIQARHAAAPALPTISRVAGAVIQRDELASPNGRWRVRWVRGAARYVVTGPDEREHPATIPERVEIQAIRWDSDMEATIYALKKSLFKQTPSVWQYRIQSGAPTPPYRYFGGGEETYLGAMATMTGSSSREDMDYYRQSLEDKRTETGGRAFDVESTFFAGLGTPADVFELAGAMMNKLRRERRIQYSPLGSIEPAFASGSLNQAVCHTFASAFARAVNAMAVKFGFEPVARATGGTQPVITRVIEGSLLGFTETRPSNVVGSYRNNHFSWIRLYPGRIVFENGHSWVKIGVTNCDPISGHFGPDEPVEPLTAAGTITIGTSGPSNQYQDGRGRTFAQVPESVADTPPPSPPMGSSWVRILP